MKLIKTLLALALLAIVAAATALWLGLYNVAADDPHWSATYRLLEIGRERSIASRVSDIQVPDLRDPELIRSGAGNYGAMCVTCHLSPDAQETELSIGLYPRPPRWDELGDVDPRVAFWVLKHGIKGSGMPAWGKSMEDRYLWGMVAFTQQFKSMTAAQYSSQVTASPGHSHGGGETDLGSGEPDAHHHESPHSSFEPVDDPMATPAESDHHSDSPHEH